MFLTLITACEYHTNFPSSIVQFDRLISDQLLYSLNIYQFDCSVLCFPFEFSSNNRTKSTSCFIFLFDLSKIMKLMKKIWKRPRKAFPGRFGALTGRPGDLMKNLETPRKSGRVGRYVSKADSCFCLAMWSMQIYFPNWYKGRQHNKLSPWGIKTRKSFSLFQLFISVIYYQRNDLHFYQISWIYLMI